ncbi:four helix bundle protein [Winogradskyella endarachnes]|uniref:Four helix bundle protein n=1 Tax=Winogradskyella endarachnes TaxID=2681965 RepID=A0A6L6U9D9_9FLAO|nr:four helix bundle protein [Winogradskyella endarachnes]MUU78893.1 four helix bundle protein [Winogradskyella endarachnes]
MRKSKYHFKFEDLTVYTKAMEYGEVVNRMVKKFPKDERFELSSQFKRAADSIALNIAEGSSGTDKQFYNYLGNAWHSAHECVSCSSKAQMRNYISSDEDEDNRRLITELSKMITSLRVTISKRINK